jgi:large subunit ribosomal protein L19
MDYIKMIEEKQLRTDLPKLKVGDYVKVHLKVKEGEKERIQIFEGTIISLRGGGTNRMITVRRLSYGIGVERVVPYNSPNIAKIEVLRHGEVRRAKLYYLRERVGKSAKVKEKIVKKKKAGEELVLEKEKVEEPAVEEVEAVDTARAEAPAKEVKKKEEKAVEAKEEKAKEEKAPEAKEAVKTEEKAEKEEK